MYPSSRPRDFTLWQYERATGRWYSIVHKTIDITKMVFRVILKVLFYLSLPVVMLGAFTGVSNYIVALLEPARRQLNKSRGQIMEEKLGIVYHDVRASYTIEQTKEILKMKSDEMDAIINERKFFIDNYELPLGDGWKIKFSRDGEYSFYKIDDIKVDSNNNMIEVFFGKKEFSKSQKTKGFAEKMIQYENTYCKSLAKNIMKNISGGVPPSCLELMRTDIGMLNAHDKTEEGMPFLEYAIKEYTGLSEINKIQFSNNKNRTPLTQEMAYETIKELEQEDLRS